MERNFLAFFFLILILGQVLSLEYDFTKGEQSIFEGEDNDSLKMIDGLDYELITVEEGHAQLEEETANFNKNKFKKAHQS
jgi:hypothetical protein